MRNADSVHDNRLRMSREQATRGRIRPTFSNAFRPSSSDSRSTSLVDILSTTMASGGDHVDRQTDCTFVGSHNEQLQPRRRQIGSPSCNSLHQLCKNDATTVWRRERTTMGHSTSSDRCRSSIDRQRRLRRMDDDQLLLGRPGRSNNSPLWLLVGLGMVLLAAGASAETRSTPPLFKHASPSLGSSHAAEDFQSRWRRSPSPEANASPEIDSLARVEGQFANLHKPKITNCDAKPSVDEESQKTSMVMQVTAEDKDDPNSPAGQIVFSIVSTHEKFNIDPNTGWLSTNKVFNREEPEREKVVHVTIKASDKGRPSLEDICTIAVQIRDINDNAPIFDRASYIVPVAQDTPEGTQIMRVSATDADEGDNQKIVYDLRTTKFEGDIEYFRWDDKTGVVLLNKKLDKPKGSVFLLKATATDGGFKPKTSEVDVTIEVKESTNKPPVFRQGPGAEIEISEGLTDFAQPIASYTADSQIPNEPVVFFELVNGRTEQTNKDTTFRAVPDPNNQQRVNIYLAKTLEYEKVQSYTLTLQVRNIPNLVAEAQLVIKVKDENNKAPVFTNIDSGAVLENEPPGTVVMEVSAIDGDGTYPSNRVTYSIADTDSDLLSKFDINPDTGVITTKMELDREKKEFYALTIIAKDGASSSILKNNKPNETPQKYRIVIKDKNDNAPSFPYQEYHAEIPEDADIGSKVIEVKADDLDTEASLTTYTIVSGNLKNAFRIEEQTGYIRVDKALDYEDIREYTLVVRAWDGRFANDTTVRINIQNVNDLPPKFKQDKYERTLKEEFVPSYPIFSVSAVDPDIGDPSVPQNITYFLDQTNEIFSHFQISQDGSLRIVKPLDRDLPNGFPVWTMFVFAKDENGAPTGRESYVELVITLEDVNDNAPFLDMPEGLVWPENKPPGRVGPLKAMDYDEEKNGPPFTFRIDPNAPSTIKDKFDVRQDSDGQYHLFTKVRFDREKKKDYFIPVQVADNQDKKAVSYLRLVIGDVNDNPMESGASEIFVYNYKGEAPRTAVGRVYVKDPDDWDLPDKTFTFKDPQRFPDFDLDRGNGTIYMREGIKLDKELNVYHMEFLVEDPVHGQTGQKAVTANVTVTVQKLPEEAVITSGSMRLAVNPEAFIAGGGRERLTDLLKIYLHANGSTGSGEDQEVPSHGFVDVFTVLPVEKELPPVRGLYPTYSRARWPEEVTETDVRFAAHGSPYFPPERMEVLLARRKLDLEKQLNLKIVMIHVDECLTEAASYDKLSGLAPPKCEASCYNELTIDEKRPTTVMTNQTTFVGVTARVDAICGCRASVCSASSPPPLVSVMSGAARRRRLKSGGLGSSTECECLNGGVSEINGGLGNKINSRSLMLGGQRQYCRCPSDNDEVYGPFCEKLGASFRHNGWSLHRGLEPCGNVTIKFKFTTQNQEGLLLYQGPSPNTAVINHTDFFAVELDEGKLKYYLNFGDQTQIGLIQQPVADGAEHSVSMTWSNNSVSVVLDDGTCSQEYSKCHLQAGRPPGRSQIFNSNAPLQVGGLYFGPDRLRDLSGQLGLTRADLPRGAGFAGCIRDLRIATGNHPERSVDLGSPADGENYRDGCNMEYVLAVEALGMNLNFLFFLLLVFIVLIAAVLLLTFYRRRRAPFGDKDIDCDIRENIINYEDEGGGEGDQTGYDLSVLRMMESVSNGGDKIPQPHPLPHPPPGSTLPPNVPGVKDFLDENKDRMDQDPDATPFDDLRHYAYEGDGNSGGSLSSLNSGTEDEDLRFDYLHNFGPRFKKLADMYGRESDSESESDTMGQENPAFYPPAQHPDPSSETWC